MKTNVMNNEKIAKFMEKATTAFETTGKVVLNIKKVCCFTSVLAFFNIIAMTGGNNGVGFLNAMMIILGILGILSGIIACPIKMIGRILALCIGGFTIGLAFMGIGCVIGLMIGVIASALMVMVAPAVVAIPHYFNELKYK